MVRLGLAAGAALLCTTAALAGGTVEPAGTWNTGRGPLTIAKAADGTFTLRFEQFPGRATGTLYDRGDGDMRMKGVWFDVETVEECAEASEGSTFWGGFDVAFHGPPALDRAVFQGVWTFCALIKPMTDGMQVAEGVSFSGEKQGE
jgi:hypothetical protein